MKWYLILHLINLYLFPLAEYLTYPIRFPSCDITDLGMGLLFVCMPTGGFLISLLYGLRSQHPFLLNALLAPLLALPISLLPIIAGPTLLNHLYGACFLYAGYFIANLLGGLTGRLLRHLCRYLTHR